MLKKLALTIPALAICLALGCATNPISGEEQLMLISEDQDVEIGREYAPEVEKELGGKIRNEALQSYIDSVGQRIIRISHRPDWQYHFIAVNHSMVNALALPGGYVFVTRGMLEKLTSEAQLAALLSHEIVHIVARHSSAAMSQQIGISLLVQGLSSAGTIPDSQGAYQMTQLAQQLIGLKYSRENEREADTAGMDYMVRAGYNPYGAVELMQMLERLDQATPIEFLSSHPSPENRVGYLTVRAQARYYNTTNLRVGAEDYKANVLDILPNTPRD